MSIFNYTLPSGATFTLEAPAGTTQAQADFIFYSQVAAGSLVGYTIGQTLTSAETRLTKFELSRLDRDTAGVDLVTVLSIVTGEPVTTVPNLVNVPLLAAITPADYALTNTGLGLDPVGPLSPEEVQGLITTTEKYVDQDPDTITDTGIGTYNLTPQNLEQAGYLKPGTSNYPDFACVIGTPSVWTGKDGVTSIAGILDDPALQTKIQNAVLQNNYNALTASGTIQTPTTSAASVSSGQIYGSNGLSTLTPAALVAGTAALSGSLNSLIRTSFSGVSALGSLPAASISSLLSAPVTSITTIASGAVNKATQLANSLTSDLATSTIQSANGIVKGALADVTTASNQAVGTIVNNAAQFTAPVAAAWSKGSALLNSGLGTAQGVLNSAVGEAKGLITSTGIANAILNPKDAVTGAIGSLSGIAAGTLGSLGTQAKNLLGSLTGSLDAFGKMSSFGVDFSLFSSDSLVSPTKVAAGFSNTVNRQTVDAAVQRILGNAKIPTPSFEFPSPSSLGIADDIKAAQTKLKELGSQVGTTVAGLTSGMSSTGIGSGTNTPV